MLRMTRYIEAIRFEARAMHQLELGELERTEGECLERLRDHPNDFHALYILTQIEFRKGEFEEAFDHFKCMLKYNKVPSKVEHWFVTQVVGQAVFKRSNYHDAEGWCAELLPQIRSGKSKVELLKYRCVCLDKLERFDELVDACASLRKYGFVDEYLLTYEKKARKYARFHDEST